MLKACLNAVRKSPLVELSMVYESTQISAFGESDIGRRSLEHSRTQ